ncbi:MAG: exopolysaccharide biosynthesis protein, partial [Gammaproteobacteria bacterium]
HLSRIIIYDLPPVLVGDDVAAFAPNLDTALLVVEEGSTEVNKLKRSIDLLEGVDIIGTVLNKSKNSTQNLEYYY